MARAQFPSPSGMDINFLFSVSEEFTNTAIDRVAKEVFKHSVMELVGFQCSVNLALCFWLEGIGA